MYVGVCPGFREWMKIVYKLPKKFSPKEVKKAVSEVWEKILRYNQNLKRGGLQEGQSYHLFTNWA